MKNYIYLDNAATTRVRQEVIDEMLPCFDNDFGNASSQHTKGREALCKIDIARGQVARSIGANPNEIYFTSGGTESDAWALRGVAYEHRDKGKHIITSSIEHPAVLSNAQQLQKEGFKVTYLPVDQDGKVHMRDLEKAIRKDTILISIMAANNEIGTIQDIESIGQIASKNKIVFHTDAVQAMGCMDIDVKKQNIDLLSISGHKIYGPKGIGALYIKNGLKIGKFMIGGGQERTMRSGTLNTSGIVGIGKACSLLQDELSLNNKRLQDMRDAFIDKVEQLIPNVKLNGHRTQRLSNNVSFSFGNIEAEGILLMLDMQGIGVSSGSACSSGSLKSSHVLEAIGVDAGLAQGTIRFTFGKYNQMQDVDYTVENLQKIVERLRGLSPLK